jgi:hypothetical protein
LLFNWSRKIYFGVLQDIINISCPTFDALNIKVNLKSLNLSFCSDFDCSRKQIFHHLMTGCTYKISYSRNWIYREIQMQLQKGFDPVVYNLLIYLSWLSWWKDLFSHIFKPEMKAPSSFLNIKVPPTEVDWIVTGEKFPPGKAN